jgi:hypothetical protein
MAVAVAGGLRALQQSQQLRLSVAKMRAQVRVGR